MKLLIATALILVFGGHAFGAAVENCHMERLNACGNPLNHFRKESGNKFPTDEAQVDALCESMKEALSCVEEYQKKCMTPMQLQMMGFMMEGSLDAYKEFCTEGSQIRTDYLTNAVCLNDLAESDEAKAQYSYVEAALEDLNEKPYEERLPTACCGYQWLTEESDKLGKDKCGQAAVDSFHKVVEMVVSSLPEVMCSGFDPQGEQCSKLLPPPGTKPTGSIRNSHIAQSFSNLYLQD